MTKFVFYYQQNEQTIEFDVHVLGGEGAEQDEDAFALVFDLPVSTTPNRSSVIKLVHYERITTYAVYDKCRDKGVAAQICVCSLKQPVAKPDLNDPPNWHLNSIDVLGHVTTLVGSSDCVYLHERRTLAGLVLEVSSNCIKLKFAVSVTVLKRHNVVSSRSFSSISANLDPGMMVFVVAFIQCNPIENWHLEYDIKFSQL